MSRIFNRLFWVVLFTYYCFETLVYLIHFTSYFPMQKGTEHRIETVSLGFLVAATSLLFVSWMCLLVEEKP